MRTRYLKPGFFENEDLAALPATTRLLFAGLWLIADRKGRLRDRPARIKGELFPYDNTNVERGLKQLADTGFIERYETDGQRLIWIPTFLTHQKPYKHEPGSALPGHPDDQSPDNDEPLADQSSDNDGSMSGTNGEREGGRGNANANANGEKGTGSGGAPGGAPPPSGAAPHSLVSLPSPSPTWDYDTVRYQYERLNPEHPLDDRARKEFRGFHGENAEWLLALVNQGAGKGFGYLKRSFESCVQNNEPPSTLKATRRN